MDQPTKIRRACDRCHTQKLRCKRIEGHNTCVRCANANLTCIFSPPGKNHKQHPGRKQSVGAAPNRQKSALSSTQNDPGVMSNGLIDIDKRPADYSQLPPVTTLQQWPTSQPEDDILLNCKYDSSFICSCFNIGHWIEETNSNSSHGHIPQSTKNRLSWKFLKDFIRTVLINHTHSTYVSFNHAESHSSTIWRHVLIAFQ